jgi:hypothetical protein
MGAQGAQKGSGPTLRPVGSSFLFESFWSRLFSQSWSLGLLVVRLKLLLLRVLLAWLAWLALVAVLLHIWLWRLSLRVVNPVIVSVVSFVGLCWRRAASILYTGGVSGGDALPLFCTFVASAGVALLTRTFPLAGSQAARLA